MTKRYILFIITLIIRITMSINRIIYSSPGGLRGFYSVGISKFIKDTYDLSEYTFYGASAGAWNSLYLGLKKEKQEKFLEIISDNNNSQYKNLYDIQNQLRHCILQNYDENDVDIEKLNICVGSIDRTIFRGRIFKNFTSLSDVLDCCIASSHIPFVSSRKLTQKYKSYNCFDGGIYHRIYENGRIITPHIKISPDMWNNKYIKHYDCINTLDRKKLIQMGYEDAKLNKDIMDDYFVHAPH